MGISPLEPLVMRAYIVDLGASFIKLAQVLATRNDFFETPYLEVLKTLHDDLPAMSDRIFQQGVQTYKGTFFPIRFKPSLN